MAQAELHTDLTGEENSRHNLQAVHLHPTKARTRIRKTARKALKDLKRIKPFALDPPYTLVCTLRRSDDAGPTRATVRSDDLLDLLQKPREYKPVK